MKEKSHSQLAYRVSGTLNGLVGTEFAFKADFDSMRFDGPKFVRMNSPFYYGEKWAVRRMSACLNRDGEWEYEPMPSSRDDEFYARCRFDSLKHAVATFKSSNNDSATSVL